MGDTNTRIRTSVAVAAVLGGGVGITTAVFGAYWFAYGSFPLAFGLDVRGDFPYPYPVPAAAIAGAVFVGVGITLTVSLLVWLRGHRRARPVALVALAAVIGLAVTVGRYTGPVHQCAIVTYTGIEHCTSRLTAVARDSILLAAVPAVALVSLGLAYRRRPLQA